MTVLGTDDAAVLINRIGVAEEDLASYAANGFLKIPQLFSSAAIAGIQELADEKLREQAGGYAAALSSVAYRLHETPHIKSILANKEFAEVLTTIAGTRLVPCETQAFGLASGTSGIPWHYGFVSFGYVRARDMGFTLWIPLSPIDAETEGGGMAYVPETKISARHGFDLGTLLAERMNNDDEPADLLGAIAGVHQHMEPLFEENKVEDSFEVGDALLFNKYVWHRSSPYRSSHQRQRLGIAMRFVEENARMDRQRWLAEYTFGGGLGIGTRSPIVTGKEDRFARFTDIDDEALISSSATVSHIL